MRDPRDYSSSDWLIIRMPMFYYGVRPGIWPMQVMAVSGYRSPGYWENVEFNIRIPDEALHHPNGSKRFNLDPRSDMILEIHEYTGCHSWISRRSPEVLHEGQDSLICHVFGQCGEAEVAKGVADRAERICKALGVTNGELMETGP